MNMARFLLLQLFFHGILFNGTCAWSVRMPSSIRGLLHSCLVIPCSFDYSSYPPTNPNRIVWYQYVDRGYPLVYDDWYPHDVIGIFRYKTSLYRRYNWRDCSLLIKGLELSHHRQKVYTWIDPENVGWSIYKFYDVASVIHIKTSPDAPSLQIFGGQNIGDPISVQCSTYHTCPYSKPTLDLLGIQGSDTVEHRDIGDGKWSITLTRKGVINSVNQGISCTVRHYGGLTASATKTHTAKSDRDTKGKEG